MTVRGVFVNASDHRDFAVGDEIFREGDVGSEMFGVVSGKVELRYGAEVISTVGPSETFGEMSIVTDAPRSLTAVAVEPSRVAVINRSTFLFLVHETPTFALEVMRSLAERLRAQDRRR
jgi:CRP/FNR family transcriptional regulator, cyclic AMP receptor protein